MKTQLAVAAALALFAAPAWPQSDNFTGRATLTVLPAHPDTQDASLSAGQLNVKLDGKLATVTSLTQLTSANSPLELILLIDGGVRTSLYGQAGDIIDFDKEIPSNTQMAIAYMENGRAALEGPLSSDPAAVEKELHMTAGGAGSNASPYFCLDDLATHWPSTDANARRVVVMITDGIDEYNPHYDPDDVYVTSAINDTVHAGMVVFTIYWHDQGRADRSGGIADGGQNLMLEVAQATGGNSYWQGLSNPVSLKPYFDDLRRRLHSEYELDLSAPFKGKPFKASLKLRANAPNAKVTAPQFVYLSNAPAER
ncbi:MAG: hypothetical protein WBE41_19695 [Terracidiphilus sp.]